MLFQAVGCAVLWLTIAGGAWGGQAAAVGALRWWRGQRHQLCRSDRGSRTPVGLIPTCPFTQPVTAPCTGQWAPAAGWRLLRWTRADGACARGIIVVFLLPGSVRSSPAPRAFSAAVPLARGTRRFHEEASHRLETRPAATVGSHVTYTSYEPHSRERRSCCNKPQTRTGTGRIPGCIEPHCSSSGGRSNTAEMCQMQTAGGSLVCRTACEQIVSVCCILHQM